jgi:hypothetical protein
MINHESKSDQSLCNLKATNRGTIRSLHLMALSLFIAAFSLVGCAGLPDDATPTLAATALVTSIETPADPTPAPLPTDTPPPATPSPAATLAPTTSPISCPFPLQPDLEPAWDEAEIGCPLDTGQFPISTAYAPFEGGQMLWRGDTDMIYVVYNDGRWEIYPNEWEQSIQEFTCGEENSPPTPIRGFGRVWCDHPAVRESLGAVTALEIGDQASAAQDFDNGTILVAPFGSLFVFNDETGQWRRIDVEP